MSPDSLVIVGAMFRGWFSRLRRPSRINPAVIPDHESAVRRLVADGQGASYRAIRSLDEALEMPDVAIVMEGDCGGSIYLTCPARLVRCDELTLRQLLHDLDAYDWDDPDGVGLHYEVTPVGSGIAGGTGGGVVTEGLWLHPRLEAEDLRGRVKAVIAGERTRLDEPEIGA